ncbi:MAG: Asp23/Gls24 family envelope stress response protein [Eubacteriales bacterium]|nr:Asp23/Gls24 family envelope stress response protein [Eubacteriales bacterium]MDD3073943.1 Asp23/Gls24 family envelope stress response protein [Eubacteriales bacterium]MDD4079742.1 Asp23/Gls24 family envelope stress response protein [Eubacteriales bacterium]MDD4769323.1 Asp23/Gls24 family envelope stress response protein [Eubacteriales bacterium]
MTGKLIVNDEVFADIALAALQKVDDVIRQQRKGTLSGLSRLLTGKFASKINVEKSDGDEDLGTVSFDLRLVVTYGVVIPEVAAKVREAVIKDVTTFTGYKVDRVDITVEKLVQPEEIANEQE